MKHLLIILLFISQIAIAQTKTNGNSGLPTTVNFSDTTIPDYNPNLSSLDKQTIPASEYGDKKEQLYKLRMENQKKKPERKGINENIVVPTLIKQYEGNAATGSPSDNDIAISDSGKVLSVVNSNIYIYNDTGKFLLSKSVSQFASQLGTLTGLSDPRVLYDPKMDRFVFACFSGNISTTNFIIVGFSKTNDPAGLWNFYKLPANIFNDSTWSDYPILSLSNDDLFLTFNQVKDNVSWTVGFKQSVIWQIDKVRGYSADSMKYTLWSDIKYNNGNLRNICPAKYQTYNPNSNMYFLSVRNVDFSNDTIFLLEITNSYASGIAQLKQKVLKSPIKYGFPPNALQAKASNGKIQQLMTNDARVLAAIYENDYIHFGSNTINTTYTNAGVLLGTIKNVSKPNPIVQAKIFSGVNLEYGYPSMTHIGDTSPKHRVLYTFSHCVTDSFAGMSMVYQNTNGEFSPIVRIKNGISIIDVFTDSIERWGDYSNAQKIYNKDGQAYMVGSWGQSFRMKTNIAKVSITDTVLPPPPPPPSSISNATNSTSLNLFPNPSLNKFTTSFQLEKNETLAFNILDISGKLIVKLLESKAYTGKNEFSFQTESLAKGNYFLVITGDHSTHLSIQFTKE